MKPEPSSEQPDDKAPQTAEQMEKSIEQIRNNARRLNDLSREHQQRQAMERNEIRDAVKNISSILFA